MDCERGGREGEGGVGKEEKEGKEREGGREGGKEGGARNGGREEGGMEGWGEQRTKEGMEEEGERVIDVGHVTRAGGLVLASLPSAGDGRQRLFPCSL